MEGGGNFVNTLYKTNSSKAFRLSWRSSALHSIIATSRQESL